MNLTKEKLKSLYEKNYSKNNEIINRFEEIEKIVETFITLNINSKHIREFAPLSDGILGQDGNGNRINMKNHADNVDDMWKLIGGFDNQKVRAKYRIISASRGKKENYYENEDYSTHGQSLWANSNFVTNNYPDQVAQFLQSCKNNEAFEDCINKSKIVLTWRTDTYLEEEPDNYFIASTERLKTRFPAKFLWMWAKKDTVIHPISLMAFRNFLNTEYGKNILKVVNESYAPKEITNMQFDEFKMVWGKISDKILEDLVIDKTDNEAISKISKLISQISIEETDIKNISDLLQTGNKAVILWGPPGTGKTYESMKVVEELLDIDENMTEQELEDTYLFSKGDMNRNEKGYYEIIQFHPNYTYQDFIGGISPKLDGKDISYELSEGIFKKFCDAANDAYKKAKDKENIPKYIFIIDEINRAELSAVFGELLFALEYRGKSINIPHFKESLVIPKNVYILGTMNNVDKSLVTFDLALRRRFGFFKLMPKLEVINDVLSEIVEKESLEQYFNKCKLLNNNIKDKLDLGEDYTIGQAYFLKIKDFLDDCDSKLSDQIITSFELEKLWIYNLEPLLEEYLGMSIEAESIQEKLKDLKDEFLN